MMQAVAFGMGGGLLQKINRDTMSFATKLSHVTYADGTQADIMKSPTGDASKISFPGVAFLLPSCQALAPWSMQQQAAPRCSTESYLAAGPKIGSLDAGPVFGLCLSACGMRVR